MKDANRNGLQNVEAIVMKTPRKLYFERAADVPNSTWPALLFRGVLPANASDKIQRFRRTFRQKGWVGIWMDSIYDYTHFHSNAHEVLGIAKGPVTLLLGAEAGRRFRLKAGDMLILPAGIGHRRVGGDEGLKVVGAYPRGPAHFNMKRRGRAVPDVPLPQTDSFCGAEGPIVSL